MNGVVRAWALSSLLLCWSFCPWTSDGSGEWFLTIMGLLNHSVLGVVRGCVKKLVTVVFAKLSRICVVSCLKMLALQTSRSWNCCTAYWHGWRSLVPEGCLCFDEGKAVPTNSCAEDVCARCNSRKCRLVAVTAEIMPSRLSSQKALRYCRWWMLGGLGGACRKRPRGAVPICFFRSAVRENGWPCTCCGCCWKCTIDGVVR